MGWKCVGVGCVGMGCVGVGVRFEVCVLVLREVREMHRVVGRCKEVSGGVKRCKEV